MPKKSNETRMGDKTKKKEKNKDSHREIISFHDEKTIQHNIKKSYQFQGTSNSKKKKINGVQSLSFNSI